LVPWLHHFCGLSLIVPQQRSILQTDQHTILHTPLLNNYFKHLELLIPTLTYYVGQMLDGKKNTINGLLDHLLQHSQVTGHPKSSAKTVLLLSKNIFNFQSLNSQHIPLHVHIIHSTLLPSLLAIYVRRMLYLQHTLLPPRYPANSRILSQLYIVFHYNKYITLHSFCSKIPVDSRNYKTSQFVQGYCYRKVISLRRNNVTSTGSARE
jgi:hypothetical protein